MVFMQLNRLPQMIAIALCLLMTSLHPTVGEESRMWASADGRFTVKAELVEVRDDEIRLRRSDGQLISVPLSRISESDREYVRQTRETPPSDASSTSPGIDRFVLPERIRVLPLFLVHKNQPVPNLSQKHRLMRHLKWCQTRYRELLSGRDTFEIAKDTPDVVHLERPLGFYREIKDGGRAPFWVADVLNHYKFTRFNCPYIFCAIVMNPSDRFPVDGGLPINGGLNRGCGWLAMSSYALDNISYFQGILQHEVGHACGLVHPGAYKYDMAVNPSIMAYNPAHRTRGFEPAPEPGTLIPEDVRALSLNDRVFPKLDFEAATDVPNGYAIAERIGTIPSMKLHGHPDFEPVISTESGEANFSSVKNVIGREILRDAGPGVTFHARYMWASEDSRTGWVSLDVLFPGEVRLNQIVVHSQHSGKYNKAHAVRIEVKSGESFRLIKSSPLADSDAVVSFSDATARHWRLSFQAGATKRVCLRGLQFFADDAQLLAPRVPYQGNIPPSGPTVSLPAPSRN